MPDPASPDPAVIEITAETGVAAVDPAEWDACACPETADGGPPCDPFTTHRFLAALEGSGSVGGRTGWLARPLVARAGGRVVAVAPMYVKSHSQGEYVFDHGWAEAWGRAGGRYYPKLLIAVPFTPVPGRRFLCLPGWESAGQAALTEAALRIAGENGLSSVHVTFCLEAEAAASPLLHRLGQQYHWHNRGYASFDDFLADLSSRKRKAIRRERDRAQDFGGTIRRLTGDAIEPRHWDAVWNFYQETGSRKWGRPYLTRAMFDRLHDTMRKDVLLVLAERGGRPVAGALNFLGRAAVFGRYWGAVEDHPFLHFECCYYQAIDHAIAAGIPRVEAGAQGDHKLARGYLPVPTHSLHWIADPAFRDAVDRFLRAERAAMDEEIEGLEALGPFRRPGGGSSPDPQD